MDVQVYDTHVRTRDGRYLHFDVLVPAAQAMRAEQYARQWLATLGIGEADVVQSRCSFCHSEPASTEVASAIASEGHYILPLQGC